MSASSDLLSPLLQESEYRRLDAEGRERFEGAGVYYAAATVDPLLYEHSTVIVVSGGNSAGQAIMYLAA